HTRFLHVVILALARRTKYSESRPCIGKGLSKVRRVVVLRGPGDVDFGGVQRLRILERELLCERLTQFRTSRFMVSQRRIHAPDSPVQFDLDGWFVRKLLAQTPAKLSQNLDDSDVLASALERVVPTGIGRCEQFPEETADVLRTNRLPPSEVR